MAIVISCAADDELAKSLYDYLQQRLPASKEIDNAGKSILLEGDEIVVDARLASSKDDVLGILSAFIKSDPDKYKAHRITEFDGVLIVGIPSGQGQLLEDMEQCEMCNYMTRYEEQLRLHKMTHGNVWLG